MPGIALRQRVAPTGAVLHCPDGIIAPSPLSPGGKKDNRREARGPMFENLSERLGGVFDRLTKQGALSEDDVRTALREVRVALLEADVSLPVARQFIKAVEKKATGAAVTKSVTPGQQVVKIVHDELISVLAGEGEPGSLRIDSPPAPILMVGLQGGGKTTTTAKLAKRLKERDGKKVLMASLDVNRPAAMEQLAILGQQIGVDTLPIVKGEDPVAIAKRAKTQAGLGGYDVYMLDTAGRLSIDEELMSQVEAVRDVTTPRETLLVVDGLTGQDAVHTAENFDTRIGISGVVLTRMDGDGRGGAALSMRAVTGKPIKFVGLGEKMDALETFEPDRVAGRILGMGDIVALVEKAQQTLEAEQAERMMKRFSKGQFNMNDLKMQLEQMIKMGGMGAMMQMMPGAGKMAKQMDEAGMDDSILRQQIALINSMTKRERANPQILQASRKKRIAKGAGMEVSDLNKLLKMQRQMSDMMKKMGKMGKGGMLKQAMKGMFGKGGAPEGMDPSQMDPKQIEAAAKAMGGKMPGGMGGMGGGGLPPGLSGFGKKK
ncbi:signal recognition particle protein [Salipiger profundus]|nr:signal recognition particle protein [Salipiger profundus]